MNITQHTAHSTQHTAHSTQHTAQDNIYFSIIIPVYNVENYLEQAIKSVLAQNYQHYEIILVDDGSTDKSFDICVAYAKYFPHINLIHTKNLGPSSARNYGMKIAKGDYILFLDSDDYWQGENILSELNTLISNKNNPDVVFFMLKEEKDLNNSLRFVIDNLSGDYNTDISTLIKQRILTSHPCSKAIKHTVILENNLQFPEGRYHEDADFCFNLALSIKTYAIYNNDVYIYRIRGGSITQSISVKNVSDLLMILNSNFHKLYEIRQTRFELYVGLFNYLARDLEFVKKWYSNLNEIDKKQVILLLEHCETLFNLFVKDFKVNLN